MAGVGGFAARRRSIAIAIVLASILGAIVTSSARAAAPSMTGYPLLSSSRSGGSSNATTSDYYVGVGDVLTVASNGSWSGSPTSFSYQWQTCDENLTNCVDISGATGTSYTVAGDDSGVQLAAVVTATNADGNGSDFVPVGAPVDAPALDWNTEFELTTSRGGAFTGGDFVDAGDTLTIGTDNWLGSPTGFTYEWKDCGDPGGCTDISGATDASYTVSASDRGSELCASATGTNSAGSHTVEFCPDQIVGTPAPDPDHLPALSTSGSNTYMAVGDVLSLDTNGWLGNPSSFTYQWQRCDYSVSPSCTDIAGETGTSHTVTTDDNGFFVTLEIVASNDIGSSTTSTSLTHDYVLVGPVGVPALADGSYPAIDNTTRSGDAPQVGDVLTADSGTWLGSPTSYDYRWQRCDENPPYSCTDVGTSNSYTATSDDVGYYIEVEVTAHNDVGSASRTSPGTFAVTTSGGGGTPSAAPTNTAPPEITGDSSSVGNELAVSTGTWSGSPTSYAYQWYRCDTNDNCTAITGAQSATYTIANADLGNTLYTVVTATNDSGSTDVDSHYSTGVVGTPEVSTYPALSGPHQSTLTDGDVVTMAAVGDTVSVTAGTWNGPTSTISYQWKQCDTSYANCTPISGATSASFTLTGDLLGSTVVADVTATNAYGSATSSASLTGIVGAPFEWSDDPDLNAFWASETFDADPKVGATLTKQNDDTWWLGDRPITYAYSWYDCAPNAVSLSSCLLVSGADSSTYTPASSDVGYVVWGCVKASNAYGAGYLSDCAATSAEIAAVSTGGSSSSSGGSGGAGSGSSTTTTTSSPPASSSSPTAAVATVTAAPGKSGTAAIVDKPVVGTAKPVMATWSAATFTTPVTVTLSTIGAAAAAQGGTAAAPAARFASAPGTQITVLDVKDSSGKAVTQFAAPIDLAFPDAPASFVPAYSHDGITWTAIPALAGPTLPDGQQDGWYRDAAGTLHVLTRHATEFAIYKKGVFGDPARNHAGAPKLSVVRKPARTRKGAVLTARIKVDEQAKLAVSLLDAHGKTMILTRAGSRVGVALTGGKVKALLRETDAAGGIPLRLALASGRLAPGRHATIVVVATDPDGNVATLKVRL